MPRKGQSQEEGRPLIAPVSIQQTTSGAPAGYGLDASGNPRLKSDILEVLKREGLAITEEYQVESVRCKHAGAAGTLAKGCATAVISLTVVGGIYAFSKTKLIKRGNVGLAMNNGVPELLAPGWHLLLSPFRSFKKQVPVSTERIRHGTINVVTIKDGFVGLLLDKGSPILLPPGMHQWDSETMIFVDTYDLSQSVTRLGPYTLLIVHDGTVGVTHNNGRLDIRGAGYHVLKHERHLYYCELDVTDQFDELNDLDLITHDNVPVNIDTTVHYKIVDTHKAALEAGKMPEVRKLVMREARAAMASSVLQSTVSDLELLTNPDAVPSAGDDLLLGDEGLASPHVAVGKGEANYDGRKGSSRRIQYLERAQRAMEAIGVRIIKIAVRKIKILDPQITKKLAQQASIRVTRLEKLDTAEVESRTVDIDAKARAKAEVTHAEAQAQRTRIMADARFYEAQKIKLAAEFLDKNRTARVLAELSGLKEVLKHTSTNTIFIGGNSGERDAGSAVSAALLSNASFISKAPAAATSEDDPSETSGQRRGSFHDLRAADDYSIA